MWEFSHFIGKTDKRKGRTSVTLRATAKMTNMPPKEVANAAEMLEDLGPVIARNHGQQGLSGGPSVAAIDGKVTVSAGIYIDAGSTTETPGRWHKGWKLRPLGPNPRKTRAGSPDPKGRNWKDMGGRWVWAGSDGDPAFTVVKKSAPFGSYYKLQMLLPDGEIFAAANQKLEKEDLFKRAAELYRAWGSAAGFDLSMQPEKWARKNWGRGNNQGPLGPGPATEADWLYNMSRRQTYANPALKWKKKRKGVWEAEGRDAYRIRQDAQGYLLLVSYGTTPGTTYMKGPYASFSNAKKAAEKREAAVSKAYTGSKR